MRRLKIAIDVDDVLADSAAGFVKFSNERWGTSLTVDNYDEHWAKMWQVDNQEVEKRAQEFHNSSTVAGYASNQDAFRVLKRLSAQHTLFVITSRRKQMQQDTYDWLGQHYPGIFSPASVYFAGIWDAIDSESHSKTKTDLALTLDADILIDDQLKHCISAAEANIQALLFGDYSWNQVEELPDGMQRCTTWLDVEREIEQIAKS